MLLRFILVSVLGLSIASAGEIILEADAAGSLKAGDASVGLIHFAPGWKLSTQGRDTILTREGSPRSDDKSWSIDALFAVYNGELTVRAELEKKESAWEYTVKTEGKSVPTNMLGIAINLPRGAAGRTLLLNGNEILLPEKQGKQDVGAEPKLTSLEIPQSDGKTLVFGFSGVRAGVTDERKWGGGFSIRLFMPVKENKITSSSMSMTLGLKDGMFQLKAAPPDPRLAFKDDSSVWKPYEHFLLVEKDSAVDFSFLLDAPAGKHGPLVPGKNGKLVYRDKPDEEFRIYGTNVVYGSNYPDQEQASLYAEQVARLGYNALRFHHYDGQLDGGDGNLNPKKLDRLDKFASELKKRGIYLSIDLYSERTIKPGTIEGIDVKLQGGAYKGLVPIYEPAREDFRRFARQLLTHVNPYTGTAWKDDPALVSLCLLNEGNIFFVNGSKVCKPFYMTAYKKWLEEKGRTDSKTQYSKFLNDVSMKFYKEQRDWIRNELGSHVLVTDTNYMAYKSLAPLRSTYQLVDNHMYVDHPDYMGNWELPWKFNNRSALTDLQRYGGELLPARLFGRPFTVTEFNYCYPNVYRAEGGIITGALAALQGWDGVFRFDYGGHSDGDVQKPIMYFSTNRDPIAQFSDRFGKLMFLGRAVRTAQKKCVLLVDADKAVDENISDWNKARASDQYRTLGLCMRTGVRVLEPGEVYTPSEAETFAVLGPGVSPDRVKGIPSFSDGRNLLKELDKAGLISGSIQEKKTESLNGEILYSKDSKQFCVTSPGVEIVISPEETAVQGKNLGVEIKGSRAAVGIGSLDGKPLFTSGRMLLVHLTDVQNSGITFRTRKRKIMTARGKAPVEIRGGSAAVVLKYEHPERLKVFALDGKGRHLYEVETETGEGSLKFTVSTVSDKGNSLSYEIVSEDRSQKSEDR